MRDLIKRITTRYSLKIIVGPGCAVSGQVPLQSGMVDDFIARKHASTATRPTSITCTRTSSPTLEETYGVILYQEQVMQIAQVLAGYTLGGSRSVASRYGQEEARGDGQTARDLHERC